MIKNGLWDEFWWNNITGPNEVVSHVAGALLSCHTAILLVPADLPWRHTMRCSIQNEFKEKSSVDNIVIESIDLIDDNAEGLDPGMFVLSRFASDFIRKGFRQKSCSVQDYITANNVIKNRIVWIKGLKKGCASQWIEFCRGFKTKSISDGLFVLEIPFELEVKSGKSIEVINYSDFVSNYDLKLFNYFLLDQSSNSFNGLWKKYISTIVAEVCDTDAEVAKLLIDDIDPQTEFVMNGLEKLSKSSEFDRRGADDGSKHILWHYRNKDFPFIEHKIWGAQVQVLFPIIELELFDIIIRNEDKIQDVLNEHRVEQFKKVIDNAIEVELGTLVYLMSKKDVDGLYWLYIPNDFDRIHLLHKCRNALAHGDCCDFDDVAQLINNSPYTI